MGACSRGLGEVQRAWGGGGVGGGGGGWEGGGGGGGRVLRI